MAMMAAADPNGTAVASAERSAAFVSFQRLAPSLPPTQNVNSAALSLASAMQFGGKIAICATNAVTTATKGSPLGQHLSHFGHRALQTAKPYPQIGVKITGWLFAPQRKYPDDENDDAMVRS